MFKVMIVDDEQLTREFLNNIIPALSNDWDVIGQAFDGQEAIDLLSEFEVDLIITDIKMPIMDGVALCQYIHENHPHIQVVILSGYGDFEYAKKAIDFNVTKYLLKPIVNDELQNALIEISNDLKLKKAEQLKYSRLLNASRQYKEELILKYLHAIISQSHVQIKSLLPLLYELEINLIEEEGVILLLQLSEETLSDSNAIKNQGLMKLLIYETATKLTYNTSNKVFIDSRNNTLIFIPINENTSLFEKIRKIFEPINNLFNNQTSYELICYVGNKENEELQLHNSYEHAKIAIIQSYFSNEASKITLYNDREFHSIEQLTNLIASTAYTIKGHDHLSLMLMKDSLLDFSKHHIKSSFQYSFCYYLLQQLSQLLSIEDDTYNGTLDIESILNYIYTCMNTLHTNKDNHSLVNKTKNYIYEHYQKPISLSIIAETLNVSSSYLSNIFHKSAGKSYIKFLTEVRLKQAATLLRSNRELTLEIITKKVGYISVKHFSYTFKKYYNISPGEYRKLK